MKKGNRRPVAFVMILSIVSMLFSGSITSLANTPISVSYEEAAFTDVQGHWAAEEINNAVAVGFVQGYTDGMFRPDNKITRAEFVAMINRALQLRDENVVHLTFADIQETDWFYTDIQKASFARYARGVDDARFLPNQFLTRVEASTMLAGLLPKTGLRSGEYINNNTNKTIASSDTLTRAEAAQIINGILAQETIIRSDTVLDRTVGSLENAIIVGDLLIDAPARDDEAALINSTVLSKLSIKGSGSGAVLLKDSNIVQLLLARNGSNVSTLVEGQNRIFVNYAFIGNHLVDTDGQRLHPGSHGLVNEIRLNGPISDEDALKITNAIAQRFFSGVKILEEAVLEGVQAIKPKSSITTDEYGTIIATVPAPPKKRVRPFVPVTGITLAPPVIISHVGSHPIIIPSVSPSNATNKNVSWSSSDESVATVQNGVLTLLKRGTATISAITADGEKTASTFLSVVNTEDSHQFWQMSEVLGSVTRSLDATDLTKEEELYSAERYFAGDRSHLERMAEALPTVPGKEEFLEYYLSPIVNRILAARVAFDELQLAAPKEAIEGAVYTMSQDAVIEEASVKTSIKSKLTELALTGITTEVTKIDYLPAVAGTKVDPTGVNGTYTFTVDITKVMLLFTVEGTSIPLTMTILATPYAEE